MHSWHRFRKLVVLAALVWLPMTVFAQICATSAQAGRLVGSLHLAAVAGTNAAQSPANTTQATSADVEDAGCGCDMKALCAFAALSVLAPDTVVPTFIKPVAISPPTSMTSFSTRSPVPDTPPPRHFLLT